MKMLIPMETPTFNKSYWKLLINDRVCVSKQFKIIVARFIHQVSLIDYYYDLIEEIQNEDLS